MQVDIFSSDLIKKPAILPVFTELVMNGVIDCLQERGLIDAIGGDNVHEVLNKPSKVYVGFDPTADSLHLGNFVGMMVLSWFQRFGHTPVIVLGGATGKIGDPSGKSTERPLLDEETLRRNTEGIRRNFLHILDFSGNLSLPEIVNNDTWLSSFPLISFLRDVGKHFRMGPMLGKESVRARIQSEEGMSFTEFSYQVLQAYDFYYLFQHQNVWIQMGGSDQWGNITAGIELIRKLTGKAAFGITFPLIVRSDGKKFGKSEEGAIWLAKEKLSPYLFYQYLMQIPDQDVIGLIKKLTFLPISEIEMLASSMQTASYLPNTAQRRLAEEVTRLVHGNEGLAEAIRVTEGVGPGSLQSLTLETLKAIEGSMPHIVMKRSDVIAHSWIDVSVSSKFLASKGEASKLVQNDGAYLNQMRVEDGKRLIQENDLLGERYLVFGAGKKKKVLIIIE